MTGSESVPVPPLCTTIVAFVLVVAYVGKILLDISLTSIALWPLMVIRKKEIMRCVYAPFMHSGIVHLIMNTTTLIFMGSRVERIVGTTTTIVFIVYGIVCTSLLYLGYYYTLYQMSGQDIKYLSISCVGFSGILFGMAVVECVTAKQTTRTLFGFRISMRAYPFVLAIVLQFLIPSLSFVGHVSGIVYGLAFVSGFFDRILCATTAVSRQLSRLPYFVPEPDERWQRPLSDTYPEMTALVSRFRRPTLPMYNRIETHDALEVSGGTNDDEVEERERPISEPTNRDDVRAKRLAYLGVDKA